MDSLQCPFLDSSCKCSIYDTRPLTCVAVEPGDAKCQQARLMKGLPMLCDQDGQKPSMQLLAESCGDYQLELEELLDAEKEACKKSEGS